MIIIRIWEEKGAEAKYYVGQIQLPDGSYISVTQEVEICTRISIPLRYHPMGCVN